MSHRDEIVDGERLDEITVTVLKARPHFNSALAWALTVEDGAGQEFEVKIWHTHDVDVWWREGWRYVLTEGRGKRRRDGKLILSSTTDFAVHRPGGVVDLLAIGDSHIGRENRPEDVGAPYRTARQFVAAMGYAARYDVDGVLHAGDLFDDEPSPEDITIAESGIEILCQHSIPFYYVYGNHGTAVAGEFYDRIQDVETAHLDTDGIRLGNTLELFGVDHGPEQEVPTTGATFATAHGIDHRLLLMHAEVNPPREDGIPVTPLCTSPHADFDYILSGHLHDPESATCEPTEIQYLGSTADISAKQSASDQCAWLLRATPDRIDLERIELH